MPIMQARKRGTVEAYQLNMDDALNLMIQPFDVSRAVNEGMAYMSSRNDALVAGLAANMFITTGPNDAWGMKVRVVTGGWATAVLCEGSDAPVAGTDLAIRALNRPAPFVLEANLAGRLDVEADALPPLVCGTLLCEVFTGACEGVVLGGSSIDDPTMWLLNPNTIYSIEVTDVSLIGNLVNITATFYLLDVP